VHGLQRLPVRVIIMKMPAETHSGNLNKSKVAANPQEGSRASGKTNDCEATLRKGNMPQASKVTTVDPNVNKGVHAECVKKQCGVEEDTRRTMRNSPDGCGSI
jgi:hypothetical protein